MIKIKKFPDAKLTQNIFLRQHMAMGYSLAALSKSQKWLTFSGP